MKRKRFVKLMMGIGFSRNHANVIAENVISVSKLELFGGTLLMTYARAWNAFRVRARIMELVAKVGDSAEA